MDEPTAVTCFVIRLFKLAEELGRTNHKEAARLRRQAKAQETPATAEQLINQALTCSLGGTWPERKTVSWLMHRACEKVGRSCAEEMLASVYAKGARMADNQLMRDKLFKYACKYAPIIIVAEAFSREGIRVHGSSRCPRWVCVKRPETAPGWPSINI